MSEIRESALLDIKAAVDRLADADESLGARLQEALERACAAASATWPQPPDRQKTPDPDALARLSATLACFARCLPVSLEGDTLVVLAAEPLDLHALRLVEAQVGQVRVVMAPAEVVWQGLDAAYGKPVKKGRKKPLAAEPENEVSLASEPEEAPQATSPAEAPTTPADPSPTPAAIPPDADLLAAFEGAAEIPAAASEPVESSVALGADDIAALFSAAEASAEPVEPPSVPVSLDDQFDELLAEVQNQSAEPTSIHEPRTQNLDLLSAFENLSEPVALSEAPKMGDVDLLAINPEALPDELESTDDVDDPDKISAQVKRIALLLHEEEAASGDEGLADCVPLETALSAMCAAIAVDGEDLVCLIEDPPNLKAAEAVAEAAGMSLRLQLATREKVLARLHEIYGEFDEATILTLDNTQEPKEGLFAKLKGKFKKAA